MMLRIQAHRIVSYHARVEIEDEEYERYLKEYQDYLNNLDDPGRPEWPNFEEYLWAHCEFIREEVSDNGPDYEEDLELWHMCREVLPMYLEKGYKE